MSILNLLEKYCDIENDAKTGLLLLDLPTGFGKTYEVLKYIFNNYAKLPKDKKIIFLTNLKKNLPHDTVFKKLFEQESRLAEFERDVVFIDSNVDCVVNNLLENKNLIPNFIKESSEYKSLYDAILYYKEFDKKIKNTFENKIQEDIKEKIQSDYEPKFRKLLTNLFYSTAKKKEQRIDLIKNDKDFQWISKVYPASLSYEKKIFFLSVDKFLVQNSPIIEKSYYFFDDNFLKNSLIFIDEFDASKGIILENIIKSQLKKRIDIIGLFEQLYSSFNSLNIPKVFYKNSKNWQDRKDKKEDLPNISQVIENLKTEIIKINEAYKINYSVKTVGLSNNKNFLFHDYQYHTIVADKKNFIYLEQDKEAEINKIHFVEADKKRKDKPSITEFLTALRAFINYFKSGTKLIAENYQYLKDEENPTGDKFSFENALYTFFDELKLSKEQQDYLIDNIQTRKFENKQKASKTESKNGYDFYQNGFRYYDFEDSEMHDTKSKVYSTNFEKTPEKLLLDLANSNLVVGVSATAKTKTVIGNYDINYLHKNLREKYIELNSEENQLLKEEFKARNQYYVSIEATFLGVDDWKQKLKSFKFDKTTTNQLLDELEKHVDEKSKNFELKRYLKVAKAYQKFIENDKIQSFICFLNSHPKKGKSSCDLDILQMLFIAIIKKCKKQSLFLNAKNEFDVKKSFTVIDSKNFDKKKDDMEKTLKLGQKLFVITTYATLGAGQNIQYGLNNFNELLEQGKIKQTYIPNNYIPEKLKDFDAIYLDKPSHLLVNVNAESLNDFSVNKRIFQAEMLFQARQIFYQQVVYEIKTAFKKGYYKDRHFEIYNPKDIKKDLYSILDYREFVAKEVIQAIGRINRTHFKNETVYIFADKEIAPHIKHFDTQNYLCLKEFEALVKVAQHEEATEPKNDEKIIEIQQNNLICHGWISSKVKGKYWSEKNIKDWQELREIVLKYPTVSINQLDQLEELQKWQFIYTPMLDSNFEKFEPKNKYHFKQQNDYSTIDIDFSGNGTEVSANSINLSQIMQFGRTKEWFEEQNYATDFKENEYIISPEIFNNIYKGALGEVVGKFIFENYVMPTVKLTELPDTIFERFDFMLHKGIFIDFKFWNDTNSQDKKAQIDKIFGLKIPDVKEKGFEFKKVFIINILAEDKFDIQISQENQLIEVPFLINKNDINDNSMILKLHTLLNNYLNATQN